jgi:hypothetical protein
MKNRFFPTRRFLAVGLLAAIVTTTACNKFDNDEVPNTPSAALLSVNLVPDKTGVVLALSGSVLTNVPLAYSNFTGGYQSIYSGNRTFSSYGLSSSDSLDSTPFNFEQDKYYSAFVVGKGGDYQNVIVRDNFDSLSGSNGKAYLRYINAIPDASQPAVTVEAGGTNVVSENRAFASVSDFVEVTPGSVTVTANNGGNIKTSRSFPLEAKKVYTVLLMGVPGSTSADSVQVKYITNGLLNEDAPRAASASARSTN